MFIFSQGGGGHSPGSFPNPAQSHLPPGGITDASYQRHLAAGGGSYIPTAGGSQTTPVSSSGPLPPELIDSALPKELQHALSDQDISAILSRQDLASSLAEDLLAQFAHQQQHQQQEGKTPEPGQGLSSQAHRGGEDNQTAKSDKLMPNLSSSSSSAAAASSSSTTTLSTSSHAQAMGEDSKSQLTDSQFLAESEKWCTDSTSTASAVKSETEEGSDSKPKLTSPKLSINMTSEQVVASCKGLGMWI